MYYLYTVNKNKNIMEKKRFKSEVLEKEGYYSISIKLKGLVFWVDMSIEDNDFSFDWNQYIFQLNNSIDLKRKAIQENCENYETACYKAEKVFLKKFKEKVIHSTTF